MFQYYNPHDHVYINRIFPANTEHLYNICTTSAQRPQRWSNIVQMFCVCWVRAGGFSEYVGHIIHVNLYQSAV